MSIKIECDECFDEIKDVSYCPKCFQELKDRIAEFEVELENKEVELENRQKQIAELKEKI